MSAATMLWSGFRMHKVEPLELTVRFARPLGVPKYMVCGLGDDGNPEVMFQGEFHDTVQQARESVWAFAAKVIAQGIDVWYRSDLEN